MSESIVIAFLTRLEAGQTQVQADLTLVKAGLTRLEARQTQLEASLVTVRTDVMDRTDRLQDTVKSMRDDVIVNFSRADRVSLIAGSASSEVRALGLEVSAMETQILRLRGDVDEIRRGA